MRTSPPYRKSDRGEGGSILLWAIGIPIPLLIIIYLVWLHTI